MSEEKLSPNKLRKLISPLNEKLNLIGEDIADILWLALKQKEYSCKAEYETAETLNSSQLKTFQFSYLWLNLVDSRLYQFALLLGSPLKSRKPKSSDARITSSQIGIILFAYLWISFIELGLYLFALRLLPPLESTVKIIPPEPKPRSCSAINQKTLPLRHRDPPSLQEPLEFAKALRPLIRKVDSGRKTILDEVETVQRIAKENICIPVFKSEPEPWLDLALIVDENPSMIIWNSTIRELKQLLENYGIFREARIWGLGTDENGKILIRAKVGKKECFKNPQELVDPTHRRLILIVSDCVSPIWFDGTLLSTLEQWTKHQPLAIIQMLPNFLWQRTGLRIGAFVELVNLIPGAANRNLRIHELLLWKEIKLNQNTTNINQGTKIPVLTLNPKIASLWSNFVVGKYDSVITGFVLPLESDFQELPPLPQSPQNRVEALDAKQKIDRFRRMSSPIGRDLAGYIMSAPVITLPVVRLIQKNFLPHSQPIHMAEVFLGGLLQPSIKITRDTNPDGVVFDVIDDEIRNIILDDFPLSDSVNVFRAISNFIESNIGKSLRECVALLADSSVNGDKEALAKAYAEISLKVLKGMGGSYAEFAKDIEMSCNISSRLDDQASIFKVLGIEPKILPFEVATIQIKEDDNFLKKLEFKTVTLVPKEQIKYQLSLAEIDSIEKHNSELERNRSRYQSYKQLRNSAQEGTDYRIETHQGISDVAIIAPHGGKIEPGATEITKAIAGDDHDFYSLEGLKPGNNHDLSIPSEKFDEPRALEIVGQANRVIAIHGFFGNDGIIHLGGLDVDLRQKIQENIEQQGFSSIESESTFEGANPNNICNRGQTGKGVQIGIPWGLRKQLFDSLKSESNEPTLFNRFVQAIRDSLSPLEAAGLRSQITQGQADYYTEELGDGVELDMISIPGGSFMMGSPEDEGYDFEKPQHRVTIKPFFMGKFQVTQAQWQAVMKNNPAKFQDNLLNPVEQVSWEDAQDFCDRLYQKTGNEYRLPTEAEWEYACRAGTDTPFNFGGTISTDLANYNGNYTYGEGVEGIYRKQTTPVGYFKVANSFGLYDMHGNVWEWCEDDYHDSYNGAFNNGSAWLSGKSSNKVVRGGSWIFNPGYCRSACRYFGTRAIRDSVIGFRVVCVAPRTT